MKQSYRDLPVWQKAMDPTVRIYEVTRVFPKDELYRLTSQMRRAAVSVPSNIAEGQARPTRGEFRQSLGHAKGSLAELETQLLIGSRLGHLNPSDPVFQQLSEVGRMLSGLVNSLTIDNQQPTTDNHA